MRIPEEIFATDKRIADYEIGLGDELVIVGLFTRFFGRTILTPIVRTGNIAMMPKEKLRGSLAFGEMEAYLAEGRSIGGLSGSPVFVRNTVKLPLQTPDGKLAAMSGLGQSHLLGLVHGHWDVLPIWPVGAQPATWPPQAAFEDSGLRSIATLQNRWRLGKDATV